MSSQSGIRVSKELASKFPEFAASHDRALFIEIRNEIAEVGSQIAGTDNFAGDLKNDIAPELSTTEPCYIVIRDSAGALGFVAFVPDHANVRLKMIYASSNSSINRDLGGSSTFAYAIFWSRLDEVSEQGWKDHITHVEADAPMTQEEQSLKSAIDLEATRMGSAKSRGGLGSLGVNANVSATAHKALEDLKESDAGLVVLEISKDEKIEVDKQESGVDSNTLPQYFSTTEPRYGVLAHHGKLNFIYVVPNAAGVRQRMVYASTRTSLLNYVKEMGPVDQIIETSDPEDVIVAPVSEQQSAPAATARTKFSRPKRPGR